MRYASKLLLIILALGLASCSDGISDVERADPTKEVSLQVTLPSGEQWTQSYNGPSGDAAQFAVFVAEHAERLFESTGVEGSVRLLVEDARSIEAGARAAQKKGVLEVDDDEVVTAIVLNDLVNHIASRMQFEQVKAKPSYSPRLNGRIVKTQSTSCDVEYGAGGCSPTETGCVAKWSCGNGSSGCTRIDPILC